MDSMKVVRGDVIVLGSGFAGLRAANAAARAGAKVVVVEKGPRATPDIMGFNVAVGAGDSEESYEEDLRRSAHFISDNRLEKILVSKARGEISFLEELGLVFDKKPGGEYDVLQTLGSSQPRLVHYKALTGIEASRLMALDCERRGVEFHNFYMIHRLILSDGKVTGAMGVNWRTGERVAFVGKALVLAMGGCGAVYDVTTYPEGIVGDGLAIAYRAGAELVDMEFIQFEPCVFIHPPRLKGKVIPTTLLKAGAQLRNGKNAEFLGDYGLDRGSVQKYSLSRAMANEIREGRGSPHGGIFYDVSMMPRKMVVEDHAIFYLPALAAGVDLTTMPAEVMPAAHTSLGGLKIAGDCSTSLPGLFAAGEATGGFHGANRLGGSAGIETLVFGGIAGSSAARCAADSIDLGEGDLKEASDSDLSQGAGKVAAAVSALDPREIKARIRTTMSDKAGLLRCAEDLEYANREIASLAAMIPPEAGLDLRASISRLECLNMVDVCSMIIESSLARKESRGVFFRLDYPESDDSAWLGNIIVKRVEGRMDLRFSPLQPAGGGLAGKR